MEQEMKNEVKILLLSIATLVLSVCDYIIGKVL